MARTNDSETGSAPPALTVYYDGACPLCSLEIAHYRSRPGAERMRFVDAASPGAPLGAGLERDAALRRFHVRDEQGRLRSGAAGFVAIWALLPGWRWLARLARVPGLLWLMERGYRAFLPLRPYLARLAAKRASG